jgi:hypothetical protein
MSFEFDPVSGRFHDADRGIELRREPGGGAEATRFVLEDAQGRTRAFYARMELTGPRVGAPSGQPRVDRKLVWLVLEPADQLRNPYALSAKQFAELITAALGSYGVVNGQPAKAVYSVQFLT